MTKLDANEEKAPVDRLVAMTALELAIREGKAEPSHYTTFCESKKSTWESSDFILTKLLRMHEKAGVEDCIRLTPLMMERLVFVDPKDDRQFVAVEYQEEFNVFKKQLDFNLNTLPLHTQIALLADIVQYPKASQPVQEVVNGMLSYRQVVQMYNHSQFGDRKLG